MNTYQDKNRERYAHLTVEIRFVGHGFQADFYDRTLATADGQGIIHCTECRDYADSLPITERANSAVRQIIKALRAESPLL